MKCRRTKNGKLTHVSPVVFVFSIVLGERVSECVWVCVDVLHCIMLHFSRFFLPLPFFEALEALYPRTGRPGVPLAVGALSGLFPFLRIAKCVGHTRVSLADRARGFRRVAAQWFFFCVGGGDSLVIR